MPASRVSSPSFMFPSQRRGSAFEQPIFVQRRVFLGRIRCRLSGFSGLYRQRIDVLPALARVVSDGNQFIDHLSERTGGDDLVGGRLP